MFFKKHNFHADNHALEEYKLAIHNMNGLVYDYCSRGGDKREILDFVIRVVRRDLVASKSARLFYTGEYPRDSLYWIPLTRFVDDIKSQTMDISDLDVITAPYQKSKMLGAVKDLNHAKFDQRLSNYTGEYYPEIDLAIISNGVHHTAAAKEMKQKVTIQADILPFAAAYGKLKTDGQKWFFPDGTEIRVGDYRLALLFTLAEMRDYNI